MRASSLLRRRRQLQRGALTLLMLALVILLLYFVRDHRWQWDATRNARNTLSESTLTLLDELPGPLSVTAFAMPQDAELGDVRKLIREFVAPYQAAKRDVVLQFVDPGAQPKLASAEDIRANGEMVIAFGKRKEHLLALNEQAFANVLMRLAREREPLLMYLTGHGERKLDGVANHDLGDFGRQLQAKGFRIASLNLVLAQEVPVNASVLVIASPQLELSEGEVKKIQRHLERGGNLLWLLDQEPLRGLQPIAETLSLLLTPGTVVDPAAAGVRAAPAIAVAANYGIHAITSEFGLNTVFPFARQIAVNDSKEWHVTPLVDVAQRGWVETGALDGKIAFDKQRDTPGPVTVALALERNVADRDQRVVVVGSGHFLANTYLGNGGNLDLGVNMINWLSGDDSFIAIQPRATIDNSLDLGRTAQTGIVLGFLILLPLAFLLAGGIVWWRRRKA